jgi:putative cell wall-binding protein
VAGASRVATAVAVAQAGWDTADHVLLATARDFPDAVAAAALAATHDAPLLLTEPDALPAEVQQTIESLGTTAVTILGGPGSVSDSVESDLRTNGLVVTRVAGNDRFATAAKIADTVATGRDVPVVALALGLRNDGGDAWPDALAAASLAGLDAPVPTLLTQQTALPSATTEALKRLAPEQVILLGGTGSVSDNVIDQIESMGMEAIRVDGDSRFTTAIEVARTAIGGVQQDGIAATEAVIVSGEDFPDALAGGALAARRGAPLLLVPQDGLTDTVDSYIRSDETSFGAGTIIGGDQAVGEFVQEELEAAVNGEPRPERVQAAGDTQAACQPNSSPDCAYTYEHSIETWERLAQCESGGNWSINTGNGYYGGLQFSLSSWRMVGGQGYPHQNSQWEQMYRAELLHDRQGWGAWPACSDRLGYR